MYSEDIQIGKTDRVSPYVILMYLSCLSKPVRNAELKNLLEAIEQRHNLDLIWDERDYRDLLLDYIKGKL